MINYSNDKLIRIIQKFRMLFSDEFSKKVVLMTEDEAWEYSYKACIDKNNNHNFEVYSMSGDNEYYDNIVNTDTLSIPEKKSTLTFHGACHSCEWQRKSYKYCLTCDIFHGFNSRYYDRSR